MREEVITYQFRVSGRVQGVWFRQSTLQQAQLLGLSGWVRNMPDGSVEGMAQGDSNSLATLKDWLGHGPEMAKVLELEWSVIEHEPLQRFEVR